MLGALLGSVRIDRHAADRIGRGGFMTMLMCGMLGHGP
jgi:hypothetical protein